MSIIDQRTPNLDIPLPHPENDGADDVLRLRLALQAIDSALADLLEGLQAAGQLIDDASTSPIKTWSSQALTELLALLAPLESPQFTGIPQVPTPGPEAPGTAIANMELILNLLAAQLQLGDTPESARAAIQWWAGQDKQVTNATADGTVTLDLNAGSFFDLVLAGNTTLAVSNLPSTEGGAVRSVVVRIRQGATPFTLAWWPGITWLAATTPAAPGANKAAEYVLSYSEAGWVGRVGAKN